MAYIRGPSSGPLEYKLVPRPTGEATQVVITEFDVPPGDRPDYFTDHNGAIWSDGVPSGRERSVHDMEVDANGIVWFTNPLNSERTLGRFDPSTGKITGYKLAGKDGYSVGTHGIAIGRDGNIWIANAAEGAFAQFNPRTEQFTRFPISAARFFTSTNYNNAGHGFQRERLDDLNFWRYEARSSHRTIYFL